MWLRHMSGATEKNLISVEYRKIRSLGSTYGMSFDRTALEKLGVLDENGELLEDVRARQEITEDGEIRIDLGTTGGRG